MKIIIYLREMAKKVLSRKKSIFNYDVDLQKEYLENLGDPADDIERSFFQYRCQMQLSGVLYKTFANLISPILMLFYICKYYKKNTIENCQSSKEDCDAVFFTNSLSDKYIPEEVSREYHSIKNVELTDECRLDKADLQFLKEIVNKHSLSWFFHLKILLKIAVYHEQIALYNPKAVIVSAEYSFTSSVMTAYCQARDIKHINVQHGEKLFYMEDSYFRFHHFYIWDEQYKDLFVRLKAEPTQFIAAMAPVLKDIRTNIDKYKGTRAPYDYKYYLAAEGKSELLKIKETLLKLNNSSICLRPHPIYSDIGLIKEIFSKDFNIEDTKGISIEQSLAGCITAVSLYSTVLQQAYYGGIQTAIDDISFPDYYQTLKKIEYIMINRSRKLSEII